MFQLTNINDVQKQCLRWRADGLRTALVPTMGYFHAGHEALMQRGRQLADRLIVSLFVNPSQFGPGEDLASYPRDTERDTAVAAANGVDMLFMPSPEAMYPQGYDTWVEVPELGTVMCGASRPTHFRGVATVVLKLFMLTCPSVAIFGQKDWQQLAVIRRMTQDLNLTVRIDALPIVREADSLALSSRNKYLTPAERAMAPHLQKGLQVARHLVAGGERKAAPLVEAVRRYHGLNLPLGTEDYLVLVHPETLLPVEKVEQTVLMAVAMRLGKARLIDNLLITV